MMKTYKATLVGCTMALLAVAGASGQGTILFQNYGVNSQGQNWSAPVYESDLKTPLGSGYEVSLYIGETASFLSLAPGTATSISGSGLFSGPTITVPAPLMAGDAVFLQVAVWQSAYGASYAQALAAGGPTGISSSFVVVFGSASSPGSTFGMPSFGLEGIPEPNSLVLMVGGLIALGWLRSKRE